MRKSRPILFSPAMSWAIIDGKKTQTRRAVKEQPLLLYRLTGDTITAIHINKEAVDDLNKVAERSPLTLDPRVTELKLHGWQRWKSLLADELQRLREEGFSGLVSVSWCNKQQGVLNCVLVPQKQEGNEISSSPDLHGLSRDAKEKEFADPSSGRKQGEQCAGQPPLGNADRKLDGQGSTREGDERRETPPIEADGQGTRAYRMGGVDGTVQPTPRGPCSWDEPRCNTKMHPWFEVSNLWVREEHYRFGHWREVPGVKTKTGKQKWAFIPDTQQVLFDEPESFRKGKHGKDPYTPAWHKRLARFMPRSICRTTVEIVDIRVERLQQINISDVEAEGIERRTIANSSGKMRDAWASAEEWGDLKENRWEPHEVSHAYAPHAYGALWNKINGADSEIGWDKNPFVWCITFKLVK